MTILPHNRIHDQKWRTRLMFTVWPWVSFSRVQSIQILLEEESTGQNWTEYCVLIGEEQSASNKRTEKNFFIDIFILCKTTIAVKKSVFFLSLKHPHFYLIRVWEKQDLRGSTDALIWSVFQTVLSLMLCCLDYNLVFRAKKKWICKTNSKPQRSSFEYVLEHL